MAIAVADAPKTGAERRRYSRHTWIDRVFLQMENGQKYFGTSFEMSRGGMSAVFMHLEIAIGEIVLLYPVVGHQVSAIVRRRCGHLFGFEFLSLSAEIACEIEQQCSGLPLFRTMLDI